MYIDLEVYCLASSLVSKVYCLIIFLLKVYIYCLVSSVLKVYSLSEITLSSRSIHIEGLFQSYSIGNHYR